MRSGFGLTLAPIGQGAYKNAPLPPPNNDLTNKNVANVWSINLNAVKNQTPSGNNNTKYSPRNLSVFNKPKTKKNRRSDSRKGGKRANKSRSRKSRN
jgi:hypothetical protein